MIVNQRQWQGMTDDECNAEILTLSKTVNKQQWGKLLFFVNLHQYILSQVRTDFLTNAMKKFFKV